MLFCIFIHFILSSRYNGIFFLSGNLGSLLFAKCEACYSVYVLLMVWFTVWFMFGLVCLPPQNKEEVMAVRLREADSIAAVAELQQHIAELEIQVTHVQMMRLFPFLLHLNVDLCSHHDDCDSFFNTYSFPGRFFCVCVLKYK